MSAILSVLLNPAVDALADQLITQGFAYFNAMQDRKAKGEMTEDDVKAMAAKLDADFDALVQARADQKQREATKAAGIVLTEDAAQAHVQAQRGPLSKADDPSPQLPLDPMGGDKT